MARLLLFTIVVYKWMRGYGESFSTLPFCCSVHIKAGLVSLFRTLLFWGQTRIPHTHAGNCNDGKSLLTLWWWFKKSFMIETLKDMLAVVSRREKMPIFHMVSDGTRKIRQKTFSVYKTFVGYPTQYISERISVYSYDKRPFWTSLGRKSYV